MPQAVGVERIAEIQICVAIIFAFWGGGHAELKSRFEILQDILPVGIVGGAATVALVHDYQVKEILWVIAVKTGAVLVLGNSLVGREVHLATLDCLAFDLVSGVAERRKGFVFGVIYEDVAVGKIEHPRAASWITCTIPFCVPEFVANLESHDSLAGARGKSKENALLTLENGADRTVNGDLLVVTRRFSRKMVIRGEKALYDLAGYVFAMLQALPEFVWRWKGVESIFESGREIVLDDSVAVGGVSKLQTENLCVLHRLAEAIGRLLEIRFRFNDCDCEIRSVAKEVVGSLLLAAYRAVAGHNDAAIGEGSLFVNVVIRPARRVELREDVFPTSIGFRK